MPRLRELRARCSESEETALELIAKKEGRKPTDVLRSLVIEKAKEYGLWPPAAKLVVGEGGRYEFEEVTE